MSQLSVIIPVYNVAPYLRACLDSVLAAVGRLEEGSWSEEREVGERMNKLHSPTPTPTFNSNSLVEIICVDDGSTDGSGEILDEYWEKVERRGGGGRKVMGKGSDPLPSFSEEQEYRLMMQLKDEQYAKNVEIVGGKPRLRISQTIPSRAIQELISELWVSPHGDREVLRAVAHFLRMKYNPEIDIFYSNVPFNGR